MQLPDRINQLTEWWASLAPSDALLAFGLPLLVWVIRKPVAEFGIRLTVAAVSYFGFDVQDGVKAGIRPAMRGLIVLVAVYAGLVVLDLPGDYGSVLQQLLAAAVIFAVFWLLNSFVQVLIAQANQFGLETQKLQSTWVSQIVRLVFFVLMLVVVLKVWGVDLGPALTGLGIAGAAVALAAQDLIRNLIAGFNNAGEMRFGEGDWIKVGANLEGIVEKMDLRSTTVRQFDLAVVHVPNAELANSSMVNFSKRTARRIRWTLALTYDTGAEQLERICRDISAYIADSDRFVPGDEANLFVRLYQFNDSSVDILVDCFVAENDLEAELEARHHLILKIKEVVEAAGAEFAFPTRTVHAPGLAGPSA